MAAAIARGLGAAVAAPGARCSSPTPAPGRAQALADELGGERARLPGGARRPLRRRRPRGQAGGARRRRRGRSPAAPTAVVSVLGATPSRRLARGASERRPVLRTMPNLAVEVGRGVICHTPVAPGDAGAWSSALELLGRLGSVVELDEEQLDAATAVMGCAPAYLALAGEALIEAGVEAGLDAGAQRPAGPRGGRRHRRAPARRTSRARSQRRSPRRAAAPRPGSTRSPPRRAGAFEARRRRLARADGGQAMTHGIADRRDRPRRRRRTTSTPCSSST